MVISKRNYKDVGRKQQNYAIVSVVPNAGMQTNVKIKHSVQIQCEKGDLYK
jgi:hypothetical protein